MATSTVSVSTANYVSLGTTPSGNGMLISPQGKIQIILASSQPAASAAGHPIGMVAQDSPFYVPIVSQQVWAISMETATVNAVVTI